MKISAATIPASGSGGCRAHRSSRHTDCPARPRYLVAVGEDNQDYRSARTGRRRGYLGTAFGGAHRADARVEVIVENRAGAGSVIGSTLASVGPGTTLHTRAAPAARPLHGPGGP
jgi:hypothetical protein